VSSSSDRPRPFRLLPGFQHYAWGDKLYVPELYDIDNSRSMPYAEVWMGAHPARPAVAVLDDREVALDALIAEAPADVLGEEVAARYGCLPYLLKILAAECSLSIQAHPTKAQAEEGFRRENDAGIPLDAPHRNYRDDNHKPELLVALTRFHALCGFRPADEITAVLERLPELTPLLPTYEPTAEGLRGLIETYLELPDSQCAPALQRLVARLRGQAAATPFASDTAEHWALIADGQHSRAGSPDRGLLFVFLLNLIDLAPGAGIYLPARTPHSYLRGVGVEIMANSDNVIRCGLTPKHVDPAELVRTVDFAAMPAPLVHSDIDDAGGARVFRTPADEFELRCAQLDASAAPIQRTAHGPEVLFAVAPDQDAKIVLSSDGSELALRRGGVCFVPDGVAYALRATGPATVYLATVP